MHAKIKSFLLVAAGCTPLMAATPALVPGRIAPADVVQQIQNDAPVRIGSASVRPVPENVSHTLSTDSTQRTLVVRSTDNLVGSSENELVVIEKDTAAVQRKVLELATDASVTAYADHGLVIVQLKRFADLPTLRKQLAEAFPAARFDLPVRYFENTIK
jgi:hypothetical protein